MAVVLAGCMSFNRVEDVGYERGRISASYYKRYADPSSRWKWVGGIDYSVEEARWMRFEDIFGPDHPLPGVGYPYYLAPLQQQIRDYNERVENARKGSRRLPDGSIGEVWKRGQEDD